jgi:glycosyltransferase involved in cell wall biosynthesis
MGQQARADRALVRSGTGPADAAIYFQIDDLLIYLSGHKTLSGIQRTVVEVIRHVVDHASTSGGPRHAFVFTELFGKHLLEAPAGKLRDLIDYLDEQAVEQSAIVSMVNEIKSSAIPTIPASGSCFVMLGAFWGIVNNAFVMAEMKRLGLSIGVYLYDLIPIEYPEFCDPVLVNDFAQSFSEAMLFADFLFAISEFSAQSVRRFLQRHNFPALPVEVVPLAHSLSASRGMSASSGMSVGRETAEAVWTHATRAVKDRPFVLYVSTIEARKNHKYLFDIWKLLIAEGVSVPDLVFVGRQGWRVGEFFEQLKSTRYLDGRVHVLHGLADVELETLYRACKFTAVTSFVEGWGLPVGESLGFGRVCVAASSSSMQEVGGDLIPYVDPLNIRDGLQTLRKLITEPSVVEGYERAIRERFKPRTWAQVAEEIIALIQRMSHAHPGVKDTVIVPTLKPRQKVVIADFSPFATKPPRDVSSRVNRLLLAGSWHRSENFGAWMEGDEGAVQFATGLPSDEEVVVFLELIVPPGSKDNFIVVSGPNKMRRSLQLSPGQIFTLRSVVRTDQQGRVRFNLRVGGKIEPHQNDTRRIGVGLVSLTFVQAEDGVGRAEILERMIFDGQLKIHA